MEHVADTTLDDLHRALEAVDEKTPTLRLVAAIAYKHGVTQSELAEWFGVERKTIYNWLSRLEGGALEDAVRDDPRPGRPRKLAAAQLDELDSVLQQPPAVVGLEAPAWTTALVQAFVHDRFDVEYSRPSCRRLLERAGLRPGTLRRATGAAEAGRPDAVERARRRPGHVWLPRDAPRRP